MELAAAGEDMKKLREIARVHIARCEAGDMQAIKELANRLDGRPAQILEHNPADSEPITKIVNEFVHVHENSRGAWRLSEGRNRKVVADHQGGEHQSGMSSVVAGISEGKRRETSPPQILASGSKRCLALCGVTYRIGSHSVSHFVNEDSQ